MLEEDGTWLIELESALLDGLAPQQIYSLTKGKKIPDNLRPEVWQLCLEIQDASNQLINFDEIYDLPNQKCIREDVTKIVEQICAEVDDRLSLTSEMESIITYFSKSNNINYHRNNGWIEILKPILSLNLHKSDTFNIFEKIVLTYIPNGCEKKGLPFHILRLLLQYHDPEICSLLDTKRIAADQYALPWVRSLFAGVCKLEVTLAMWDIYFQVSDPFYIFFLCLIMIINARDQLLSMQNEDKQTLIEFLLQMPGELNIDDVSDFCSLSNYYSNKTPLSFRQDVLQYLMSSNTDEKNTPNVSQMLCLPVSVHELVENATIVTTTDNENVRFFLVDCRPVEQYNAGHLSTAFHLDCNLMLQEPKAFETAVQGLLHAQKQALAAQSLAAGEHLCFVGSGRVEEDSYAHMVVASFLKRNTKHVSMLDGGYTAIHNYFGNHMIDCLEDHNYEKCLVCTNCTNYPRENEGVKPVEKTNASTIQLFKKLSSAMRAKSQEVKGKLIDYIVNPNTTSSTGEWHVSVNEVNEKRYRNVPPVFSIDGEELENFQAQTEEEPDLLVKLEQFLKSAEVLHGFKCQEVLVNGYMHDSYLVITATHLIVLRELENQDGVAKILTRRPLSQVLKITAKKRHPELITFKYGIPDGEDLLVKDMDRFLIPNASEATKLISHQIIQQLNTSD